MIVIKRFSFRNRTALILGIFAVVVTSLLVALTAHAASAQYTWKYSPQAFPGDTSVFRAPPTDSAQSANGKRLVQAASGNKVKVSADGGVTWTQHDALPGGSSVVGVTASTNGLVMYAYGRAYSNRSAVLARSLNGGTTWSQIGGPLGDGTFGLIVGVSPDGKHLVLAENVNYIDYDVDTISISDDHGGSWRRAYSKGHAPGALRYWFSSAAISSDGQKIIMATDRALLASHDGGATWEEQKGAPARSWSKVAISADGTQVLAYDSKTYIGTTPWNGRTWSETIGAGTGYAWTERPQHDTANLDQIAISANGKRIFVAENMRYLRVSQDSGTTWVKRDFPSMKYVWRNGLPNQWSMVDLPLFTSSIPMSADGLKIASIGFSGAQENGLTYLYTSADGGVTWTKGRMGTAVAASADGMTLVMPASAKSVYVSKDGGVTWGAIANLPGVISDGAFALSADGSKIYVPAAGSNLFISTDSGKTWSQKSTPVHFGKIAVSADGMTLAAIGSGQVYISIDGGTTWIQRASTIVTSGHLPWSDLALSADGKKVALIPHAIGFMYVSTDGGATWVEQSKAGEESWTNVEISADSSTIVAVQRNAKIFTASTGQVDRLCPAGSTGTYPQCLNYIPPTLAITASPTTAVTNDPLTITWSSTNTSFCMVSGPNGSSRLSQTGTTGTASPLAPTTPSTATYKLDCRNNANTATTSANATVVVRAPDTAAPKVGFIAPNNNGTVSGSSVSISATSTDRGGVASVQFYVDGVKIGSEDASEPYQISWDSTSVSNGTHTLSVTSRDRAGNIGVSASRVIRVNNTGIVKPLLLTCKLLASATSTVVPNGSFILSWEVTGSSTAATIERGATVVASGLTLPRGSTSVTAPSTVGRHAFLMKISAIGGETSTCARDIVVAEPVTYTQLAAPVATPPAGVYDAPVAVSLTSSGAASIRYTTTSVAPTCKSGSIYADPIKVTSDTTIRAIACPASVVASKPQGLLAAVFESVRSLFASVLVAVTNTSRASTVAVHAYTLKPDIEKPTISMASPEENAKVSGANVTLSATASDNFEIAGVKFQVDGTTVGAEDTTAPYSVQWDTTSVRNGSHTVSGIARDRAGNERTATSRVIQVDNVVPETPATNAATPVGSIGLPNQSGQSCSISGWTCDADNLSKDLVVEFYEGNRKLGQARTHFVRQPVADVAAACGAAQNSDGTFTKGYTTTKGFRIIFQGLPTGTHWIDAKAVDIDSAGKPSSTRTAIPRGALYTSPVMCDSAVMTGTLSNAQTITVSN